MMNECINVNISLGNGAVYLNDLIYCWVVLPIIIHNNVLANLYSVLFIYICKEVTKAV